MQDDRLCLIFTCCHPALSTEAQVALTLRLLGGADHRGGGPRLPRGRAHQDPTPRPRQAEDRGGQDPLPGADDELPQRQRSVLAVTYLIYNAGADSLAGGHPRAYPSRRAEPSHRRGRTRRASAALTLIDGLNLDGYHPFHATRADLLRRLDRPDDAVHAYETAASLAPTAAERKFLAGQAQLLSGPWRRGSLEPGKRRRASRESSQLGPQSGWRCRRRKRYWAGGL